MQVIYAAVGVEAAVGVAKVVEVGIVLTVVLLALTAASLVANAVAKSARIEG